MNSLTGKYLVHMVCIALITAFICVIAPFVIPLPFSPIPISLTTFIFYLSLYAIGTKFTVYSCLLYLLLGFMGLPVFAGFNGGISRLIGPTGGYILGYLAIPLISGPFLSSNRFSRICLRTKLVHGLGLSLGTFCCYALGTFWLSFQTNIPMSGAFLTGVVPFLPGDLIKIILALYIGPKIRARLQRTIS